MKVEVGGCTACEGTSVEANAVCSVLVPSLLTRFSNML
jgi:hypothetical protein